MSEGEGARVKRGFPTDKHSYVDPFVLVDEFFVDESSGFPQHPHRGFEALTYMLDGSFEHRDTTDNSAIVEEGGVQRITMGSGVEHSETPKSEGLNHGIQLWINLPKDLKEIDPSYQVVPKNDLPIKKKDNKIVKTIVGKGSPVTLKSDIAYKHIILKNIEEELKFKDRFHGFLYVISGTGSLRTKSGEYKLEDGLLIFKEFDQKFKGKINSKGEFEFIKITGIPHNEEIYQHGPYVD